MKKYIKFISVIMVAVILTLCTTSCKKIRIATEKLTTTTQTTQSNTVKVMFPEGYTIIQIAEKLEENNVCSKESFLDVCNQPYDGIEIENPEERVFLLEGYIFPDTYEFYKNSDARNVIKKFIDNYKSKIKDEYTARAQELGYTMDEILTLASILQKECDEEIDECSKVSSVFHNRMNNSGYQRLQSDVTAFYIKKNLKDYLGYQDGVDPENQNEDVQKYLNLYSTYICRGLPAGPICNPSMKAITAALYPADTNYYYFLTDASGKNFYYAETFEQHQANGRTAGIM